MEPTPLHESRKTILLNVTATPDNPSAQSRSSYGMQEDENGNTYFILDWNQDPSTERLAVLGLSDEGLLTNLGTADGIKKEDRQMTFLGEVAESDFYHFYYPTIDTINTHIKEYYNAAGTMLEKVSFDMKQQTCDVNRLYDRLQRYDVMYSPLPVRPDRSLHAETRLKRACAPISMKFILPRGIKQVTSVYVSDSNNEATFYGEVSLAYEANGTVELQHGDPVSYYHLTVIGDKDDESERELVVTFVMPTKTRHISSTRGYSADDDSLVVTLLTAAGDTLSASTPSSSALARSRIAASVALSRR
jgi:hypothetical protein